MSGTKLVKDETAPAKMVKQEPVDVELEGQPYYRMNRKARRKMAKQAGVFKDHSGETWQIANKRIDLRRQK